MKTLLTFIALLSLTYASLDMSSKADVEVIDVNSASQTVSLKDKHVVMLDMTNAPTDSQVEFVDCVDGCVYKVHTLCPEGELSTDMSLQGFKQPDGTVGLATETYQKYIIMTFYCHDGELILCDRTTYEEEEAVTIPVTAEIYTEKFAGASSDGITQQFARNSTMTLTATGRWDVVFNTPHSDGDEYHVSITSSEPINTRDSPYIHVVEGTKSANGFSVYIATGDNGAGADVLANHPWSFGVRDEITVLTE